MSHLVLVALEHEGSELSAVLRGIEAEDYETPTNCPPWTLHELVVHIADSIWLPEDLPSPPAGAPLRTAADYYRRDERDSAAYRKQNVETAQQSAREVSAGAGTVSYLSDALVRILTRLDQEGLDQVVDVPAVGAMRLEDYAATRVMSLAAHGLDVAISLRRTPWTSRSALTSTRKTLVALLGQEPPAALGWNDQQLLLTGTGRRGLTAHEQKCLGDLAGGFPLLS